VRRGRRIIGAAIWLVLPALFGFDLFKSSNHDVQQGNAAMKAGKAEDALAAYDKAAAKLGNDPAVHFDRGAALSALSRFDEAAEEFLRATEAKDGTLKESAFYNLGNAFAKKNKFKEAIEAYKRALALDPRDASAKWNLELAQKQQKEEEKKKQDDKNKDDKNKDKKDNQEKKDKKDDQKKDDQKKDDQKKSEDDKKDQDKPQDKQDKKDQPQPADDKQAQQKPASEKEIEAVLDSLERSPKDLEKERARLRAVRRRPPAKDW
jgi:Ca-activated chloride channel family protein